MKKLKNKQNIFLKNKSMNLFKTKNLIILATIFLHLSQSYSFDYLAKIDDHLTKEVDKDWKIIGGVVLAAWGLYKTINWTSEQWDLWEQIVQEEDEQNYQSGLSRSRFHVYVHPPMSEEERQRIESRRQEQSEQELQEERQGRERIQRRNEEEARRLEEQRRQIATIPKPLSPYGVKFLGQRCFADYTINMTHHFFSIFSGHKGNNVSHDLAMNFLSQIMRNPNFQTKPQSAILEESQKANKRAYFLGLEGNITADAIFAFVIDNRILLSSAGKCKAILAKTDSFNQLNADEYSLTNRPFGYACEISKTDMDHSKSNIEFAPEIQSIDISQDDEFLILLSDTCLVGNAESVEIVKKSLRENPGDFKKATDSLAHTAADRTPDDVIVIVLDVKKIGRFQ